MLGKIKKNLAWFKEICVVQIGHGWEKLQIRYHKGGPAGWALISEVIFLSGLVGLSIDWLVQLLRYFQEGISMSDFMAWMRWSMAALTVMTYYLYIIFNMMSQEE